MDDFATVRKRRPNTLLAFDKLIRSHSFFGRGSRDVLTDLV